MRIFPLFRIAAGDDPGGQARCVHVSGALGHRALQHGNASHANRQVRRPRALSNQMAGEMSVCVKSAPLNRSGSPLARASA